MPTIDRLIVATGNAHKTEEIRAVLADLVPEVADLRAHPEVVPAEETGTTFAANAALKALGAAAALPAGSWVLADDSGLEVDALDGAPGVYSARYAGEGATDADNRAKLLAALTDVARRAARFRCVLVLARAGDAPEVEATFDGACEGTITTAEQGAGGFGYDPLFRPDGHDATFGELPAEVKNGISHRARALAALRVWLEGR